MTTAQDTLTDNLLTLQELEQEYYNYLRSLINFNNEEVIVKLAEGCAIYRKQYDTIQSDFDQIMIEEIKLRVIDLHNTTEAYTKGRKKAQLALWLNRHLNDKREVEKIIESYSIKESPIEVYTLGELLNSDIKTNRDLVKGIIPLGGMILVPAQAKSGKSVYGSCLTISVATGIDFLNRPVLQGNVLFVQNEENVRKTTAKRLRTGGLQTLELEDFNQYNELIYSNRITLCKNLDIVTHQVELLELVKKYDCKLVVIDSLNGSIRQSGLTDVSSEIGNALYGLQTMAHENDFTIVLLHHNNKTSYNGGTKTQVEKIDSIAGSSKISRTNDGMAILTRKEDPNNGNYNELHTIPRDGDPVTIQYKLIYGEACSWRLEVIKETVLTPENLQLQNNLLRLLFEKWYQWDEQWGDIEYDDRHSLPFGYTLEELINAVGEDRELVIERLNDMINSEGIIYYADRSGRKKRWLYAIPKTGETWLTHFLDKEDEAIERNKQKEEEVKLQQDLIKRQAELVTEAVLTNDVVRYKELTNSWKTDLRVKIMELLTPEVKNLLWLMVRPPLFSISTPVTVEVENEYISTSVEKVEYNTTDKYHIYYLVGFPDRTFRCEQLSKIDEQADGEISNEGDF
jgi:hypothetical protein